jgi:hypothetical protein
MGEVQGHGSPKILDLLREGVRQPREAAHAHPHGQVLTFNQTRRDVSRIGVTCNYGTFGTDNVRRTIPPRALLALLRKI